MSVKRALIAVLVLMSTPSCRPDDQRTNTMDPLEGMLAREDMPIEVVAQLDSGSARFRADDFAAALVHYERVTEMVPDAAAGWFGVYMAHQALGDVEAAREALERAQGAAPGATLIHPSNADTMR